jgi:hypothetical protein
LLAKREVKGLDAGIEEFDFEGAVHDWTFLPDELIEPGLTNFAGAVRGSVNAAIFAGSGAIQSNDKAYWLGVLRGSEHQVQVAAVEPEHDLSGHCLEHGAFHDPLNPQWFSESFAGALNTWAESFCSFSGEAKFWAWRYPMYVSRDRPSVQSGAASIPTADTLVAAEPWPVAPFSFRSSWMARSMSP